MVGIFKLLQTLICLGLLAVWFAFPASAQFRQAGLPERLAVDEVVNLYSTWEGATPLQGAFLDIPVDWALQDVTVLRNGYEKVPVQVEQKPGLLNRYVLRLTGTVDGELILVMQVETGVISGRAEWFLTPFSVREQGQNRNLEPHDAFRTTRLVELQRPFPVPDNRVFALLPDEQAPLLFRQQALPDLGTTSPHTVEFWMKTSGLGEVIFSTWNGDEDVAYPLELVIDDGGRLFYFQGQPGEHRSMMTQSPVADGQWHHVAVSHDPFAGWTRLFLDGRSADSLYAATPMDIEVAGAVAWGGRVPLEEEEQPYHAGNYTGFVDALRFWPRVRSEAEILTTIREKLPSEIDGVVVLDFEQRLSTALLERGSAQGQRVFSDLEFYQPVSNVGIAVEAETVLLSWEAADRQALAFVVERSNDSNRSVFEEVGRLEAKSVTEVVAGEPMTYTFRDTEVTDQVVFYRIRQVFRGGAERVSNMIKVGMGAEEEDEAATLIGNFPNPFNPTTTIAYTLQEPQYVQLSVWDLSGQQIMVLTDESQAEGYYEVQFQGHDLPSGTYFIRMQTDNGVLSRQMVLMK